MAVDAGLRTLILAGGVIPAHPLAITTDRRLDEVRQRALTRYQLDAGAAGIAVGVHTTQFEIHSPGVGLLRPVLTAAVHTADAWQRAHGRRILRVAGVVGRTRQALFEAAMAADLGYDAVLVSLAAMGDADDAALAAHCREIADVLPVFGFYLQPAVGGRVLAESFWRLFFEIPDVVAVKVAPFDRYATLDVARALAASGRAAEIALYTGNDDAIVGDLLSTFGYPDAEIRFVGGLLGQWCIGTRRAVALMDHVRAERAAPGTHITELLRLATQITDLNAAVFDAPHRFAGCLAGIQEMLRCEGLLEHALCLGYNERLSPGQAEAIAHARARYPHLLDTDFIKENIEAWMS